MCLVASLLTEFYFKRTSEHFRGSAALWMDLKSSGTREVLSTHGGCPVLMGSKWILNKWIYFFDQWKTYPCSVQKHKDVPPFSGYYRSVEK
jgi:hypothetical protein